MKISRKSAYLFLSCLLLSVHLLPAQNIKFAKLYSNLYSNGKVNSMDIDKHGNYIWSGCSIGSHGSNVMYLGQDSFVNATTDFMISVDSTGKYNWGRALGNGNVFFNQTTYPLFVLSHDRIFACGMYTAPAYIGDSLMSVGTNNAFIARFDLDGSLKWVKTVAHGFEPLGMTEDRSGNLLVTGMNQDSCTIGSTTLTKDIILAKFDTSATVIWAKDYGIHAPVYLDWGSGVSTDYLGNIYMSGHFRNDITFDAISIPVNTIGGHRGFIAKFDPNGNALWAKYNGYWSNSIATDSAGNSYSGGYTYRGAAFDTFQLNAIRTFDSWFLAKYDNNGNFKFLLIDSTCFVGSTLSIKLDKSNNCIFTGYSEDSFTLSGHTVNGQECRKAYLVAFLAAIDPLGNFLWAKADCGSSAMGYSLAMSDCKVAYAGIHRTDVDTFSIDGISVPIYPWDTAGGRNEEFFIAAFDTCGNNVNVGINAVSGSDGINLYPNPANQSCTISVSGDADGVKMLRLADMEGRDDRYLGQFSGHSFTFSVSPYPAGIYLLKIVNGNGQIIIRKLVIM